MLQWHSSTLEEARVWSSSCQLVQYQKEQGWIAILALLSSTKRHIWLLNCHYTGERRYSRTKMLPSTLFTERKPKKFKTIGYENLSTGQQQWVSWQALKNVQWNRKILCINIKSCISWYSTAMFHKDFTLFLLRSEVIYLFLIRNSLIITKSFKNSTLKKNQKNPKKRNNKKPPCYSHWNSNAWEGIRIFKILKTVGLTFNSNLINLNLGYVNPRLFLCTLAYKGLPTIGWGFHFSHAGDKRKTCIFWCD